jgi:hypothetical protein
MRNGTKVVPSRHGDDDTGARQARPRRVPRRGHADEHRAIPWGAALVPQQPNRGWCIVWTATKRGARDNCPSKESPAASRRGAFATLTAATVRQIRIAGASCQAGAPAAAVRPEAARRRGVAARCPQVRAVAHATDAQAVRCIRQAVRPGSKVSVRELVVRQRHEPEAGTFPTWSPARRHRRGRGPERAIAQARVSVRRACPGAAAWWKTRLGRSAVIPDEPSGP